MQALWIAARAGHRDAFRREDCERREAASRFPELIIEWRRVDLEGVLRRERLPHEHEARWILVGQRAKEDAVHDREHSAADAGANGECQRDQQRESRAA